MSDAIESAIEAANQCDHGQLARSCRECELEAEIEVLRGQVAETRKILAHTVMGSLPNEWPLKDIAEARLHDMIELRNQVRHTCVRAETAEAKLADALSLLAHKGHDADCPAGRCSFVGFTGRCGESPEWHKQHKVGHEYQSPPCSDACGLERCGVKA